MTTTNHTNTHCSCGESHPHKVARRQTADGTTVYLWSDGAVTGNLGFKLPGVPIARPRTEPAKIIALVAGWLLMGEACIHNADDLGDLYAACRWAAQRDRLPGTVRARLADIRTPRLTPVWTVLRADRDGNPTERYWRLPRLRWPGTVVWDHVSVGASGGRYEIMYLASGTNETCIPTGIRFSTLREVSEHLLSEGS